MALTVSELTRGVFGHLRASLVQVTFDASYPTGGEDFTPGQVGMSEFEAVFVEGGTQEVRFDHTNNKLLAYGDKGVATAGGPFEEVAATTDLSAFDAKLLCLGV